MLQRSRASNRKGRPRRCKLCKLSNLQHGSAPTGAQLLIEEGVQAAKRLERFGVEIIIVDDDAEAIFQIGEQGGDGHGIKLGQRAEQGCVGPEGGDAIGREAEGLGEGLTQRLVGGGVMRGLAMWGVGRAHGASA